MVKLQNAPGFKDHPDKLMEIEPSPRRVCVQFNGKTIVDTINALLLREGGHVPVYYFPMADIAMDLLEASDHTSTCPFKGEANYWTVSVGEHSAENAAWGYQAPYIEAQQIKNHIAFYWNKMDAWLEEDEEVFVHARDPKKRVDCVLSHREVKIMLGGEIVGQTTNATFLFETGLPVRYYIPPEDVLLDLLVPSSSQTQCPYKGVAHYHHAEIGGETYKDIAWVYPDPIAECPRVKDLICFFNERVDAIFVDGVEQPIPETQWSKVE